jgi:hypothetical protein
MKSLSFLFAISFFVLFACNKDKSLEPIGNRLSLRDGNLSELLELLHANPDGVIRFENYLYNFNQAEKYGVHGFFEEEIGITQLTVGQEEISLNEQSSFHYDSRLPAELTGPSFVDFADYFGTTVNLKFHLQLNQVVSTTFEIPQKLVFDIAETNPVFYPGKTIAWNPNQNDIFGIYIVFEYDPAANIHIPAVVNGTAYQNKLIWYVHTEDDGSYTFSSSDFSQNIPDNAWIGFRSIRASINDVEINDKSVRLAAHTEVHGMCKYQKQQ